MLTATATNESIPGRDYTPLFSMSTWAITAGTRKHASIKEEDGKMQSERSMYSGVRRKDNDIQRNPTTLSRRYRICHRVFVRTLSLATAIDVMARSGRRHIHPEVYLAVRILDGRVTGWFPLV